MGKHTALYYESTESLLEFVIPFFTQGLSNNMLCIWIVPRSLGVEEARIILEKKIKDLSVYIEKGQFELLSHEDLYLKNGVFNPEEMFEFWAQKEQNALKQGFSGIQVSGDGSWLQEEDWFKFIDYEETANKLMPLRKIVALCTFPIESFGPARMFSLSFSHDATIKRDGGGTKIIKF